VCQLITLRLAVIDDGAIKGGFDEGTCCGTGLQVRACPDSDYLSVRAKHNYSDRLLQQQLHPGL